MKIIDNFLPIKNYNKLKNLMLGKDLPWYYNPDVNFKNIDSNDFLFYMTHMFYNFDNAQSPFFKIINENLLNFIDVKSLIRVKGNLYPNQMVRKTNGYHKDYEWEHKGAIFYINSNNGRTIFEDNTKVESVANRILFFNPSIKHDSENCNDQKVRVNLNINYF